MSIEEIISKARNIFDKFDTEQKHKKHRACYKGSCGLSQSCINYAAKLYGVPDECIKLCHGSILVGITHAFVILILDKFYLCDLSFGQFICEEEDIDENIQHILTQERYVDETRKNINDLLHNGYTLLTEPTLICFYTFCYRHCDHETNSHTPDLSEIKLQLNPIYVYRHKVNIMQLTIEYNWKHECDINPTELLERGSISIEEYTFLEKQFLEKQFLEKQQNIIEEKEKLPQLKLKRTNAMII